LQAATALLLSAPLLAAAGEECAPLDARTGIQRCKAGLAAPQVEQMRLSQEKSQWCWAASLAMVFAHHGYVLAQDQIVQTLLGNTDDRAIGGEMITRLLTRGWQDGRGRRFETSATAGDAPARRFQFNDDTVIREMAAERPLIVGALGHAMVLVEVEYERFVAQDAVRITGGTVIDPAVGQGVRRLGPRELNPSYVAAVQVQGQQLLAAATLAD
jgi:hypothetical protein